MLNALLHGMALVAAIVLPEGLLVYFAWRAAKRIAHPPGPKQPTPDEARVAFRNMFPRGSLRAQSRRRRLERVKTWRRRNSENNQNNQ